MPQPEHSMSKQRLRSSIGVPLTIAALVCLADAVSSAPAPKGDVLDKVPEAGVAAEPADGDADKARKASMDNLKRLALAVHGYLSDHDDKLPTDITDKDGKVLLSWRVRVLPYLEQAELYK